MKVWRSPVGSAARSSRAVCRDVLPTGDLSVVVNTADDFDLWGLHICPDLDTVMYTLAGISNPETGWGIAGETFETLNMLERYGEEIWFKLGDRDLATHVLRTSRLRSGETSDGGYGRAIRCSGRRERRAADERRSCLDGARDP